MNYTISLSERFKMKIIFILPLFLCSMLSLNTFAQTNDLIKIQFGNKNLFFQKIESLKSGINIGYYAGSKKLLLISPIIGIPGAKIDIQNNKIRIGDAGIFDLSIPDNHYLSQYPVVKENEKLDNKTKFTIKMSRNNKQGFFFSEVPLNYIFLMDEAPDEKKFRWALVPKENIIGAFVRSEEIKKN